MTARVIQLDTRAMKIIRASSADIKGIARMINERGALLIEDGLEPVNILSLVNLQLQRLIDGTMDKCMNSNCSRVLTVEDFFNNPLVMTCCEECTKEAARNAAETIIEQLRLEIPKLGERVRETKLSLASSAVRQGDVIDQSQSQNDDIDEKILQTKKMRLENLLDVMIAINHGEFSTECKNKHCGEEIPIISLINSPEIGYCLACRK